MINNIIAALKQRCPSFGTAGPECRFAGAAEYAQLDPAVKLEMPAGYVIPMDDEPYEQESSNGYKQIVRDVFAVVVVLSNSTDERGQTSIEQVQAIRFEIFRALLAWKPDEFHDRIQYEGGQLMGVDRARLYYQFEFSADTQLDESDTWQQVMKDALPNFEQLGINLDAIDPYDPNLVTIGPDGRIEVSAEIDVPQT
jgi:hypothetical protein